MSVQQRNWEDVLFKGLTYASLAFFLLMILGPFLYVLSVSFRVPSEWFTTEVYLIPKEITIETWSASLNSLLSPLWNSFFIASGTSLFSMLIVIPGAYVLGRKDFTGRETLFYTIIVAMMFPYIILIIPIVDLWYNMGLFNTIPGLWIAYQVFIAPFAIWVLRDYFQKLPVNIEEAAQVYGCSQFTAFVRVILPISLPAIVAVGFLAFNISWNDFLFANLLTTGTGPRPAVVELYISTLSGEGKLWGRLMAQTLMIGLPPTILYMFARRYLTNAFAVN